MTKPTGMPRGRPKGEAYVTIMARVPLYMQQLMQASASLHGATISELLRHWIDAGLQQEAPTLVSDKKEDAQPAILSDTNEAPWEPGILSDTKEAPQEPAILSDIKWETRIFLLPCGHPEAEYNAKRRVCRACDRLNAQRRREARKAGG